MDVNLNSITGVPYSHTGDFAPNPIILIIFSVVIIGYYALFSSFLDTARTRKKWRCNALP